MWQLNLDGLCQSWYFQSVQALIKVSLIRGQAGMKLDFWIWNRRICIVFSTDHESIRHNFWECNWLIVVIQWKVFTSIIFDLFCLTIYMIEYPGSTYWMGDSTKSASEQILCNAAKILQSCTGTAGAWSQAWARQKVVRGKGGVAHCRSLGCCDRQIIP